MPPRGGGSCSELGRGVAVTVFLSCSAPLATAAATLAVSPVSTVLEAAETVVSEKTQIADV